jgi:hypothetical protein
VAVMPSHRAWAACGWPLSRQARSVVARLSGCHSQEEGGRQRAEVPGLRQDQRHSSHQPGGAGRGEGMSRAPIRAQVGCQCGRALSSLLKLFR